ncbi:NYN domain-containing protein [Thermopetrobacter sp. TC1]|uniref:NYN domain-containing protein n=1 Tax=Thermopetrobacter sp. TC1 TaxID=1495045 RepID=UPI00068EC691|nr:NYN domain-containing protein [Thermopetrobacter sp. TC1]
MHNGSKKGVDSLIVTDLITLAQNKAISDAILLSGDEDLRVGVQMAQIYGVRVHLLGIEFDGTAQSFLLMQEADTCSIWNSKDIIQILEYSVENEQEDYFIPKGISKNEVSELLDDILNHYSIEEIKVFQEYMKYSNIIPRDLDGRVLCQFRDKLKEGNLLSEEEKMFVRLLLRKKLREKCPGT